MSAVVVMFPIRDAGEADEPLCSDYDPDWWFDEACYDRAIEVCQRCPVRGRCLNQALNAGETVGVWGGLTPMQRAALPNAVVVPMRRRSSRRRS
jgi:hypothetical protein